MVVGALIHVDVGGLDVAAVAARGVLQLLHHGQNVDLQLMERGAAGWVTGPALKHDGIAAIKKMTNQKLDQH